MHLKNSHYPFPGVQITGKIWRSWGNGAEKQHREQLNTSNSLNLRRSSSSPARIHLFHFFFPISAFHNASLYIIRTPGIGFVQTEVHHRLKVIWGPFSGGTFWSSKKLKTCSLKTNILYRLFSPNKQTV